MWVYTDESVDNITIGKRYSVSLFNNFNGVGTIVADNRSPQQIAVVCGSKWLIDSDYGKGVACAEKRDEIPTMTKLGAWKIIALSGKSAARTSDGKTYLSGGYTKEYLTAILTLWDDLSDIT
jgi:hypothetical protein